MYFLTPHAVSDANDANDANDAYDASAASDANDANIATDANDAYPPPTKQKYKGPKKCPNRKNAHLARPLMGDFGQGGPAVHNSASPPTVYWPGPHGGSQGQWGGPSPFPSPRPFDLKPTPARIPLRLFRSGDLVGVHPCQLNGRVHGWRGRDLSHKSCRAWSARRLMHGPML